MSTLSTAAAIYTYLKSVPEITELVGDRIFVGVALEGTEMPFITIQRINNRQETAHDGDQGIGAARYQFNSYSANDQEVLDVREALLAINGQRVTVDGFGELVFLHEDDRENFDSDTREYEVQIDFTVWH